MNNLEKILPYLSVAKGDKGYYRVVYDGYFSNYNDNGIICLCDVPDFLNEFSMSLHHDVNIRREFGFIYDIDICNIGFSYESNESNELLIIDFICRVSK